MIYQNHVIDPTFFYDAIEEFAFNYIIHVVTDENTIDEYGKTHVTYKKQTIRGSLQDDGVTEVKSKTGNTRVEKYRFYCKSLYRINIGDIIEYKNKYLRVNFVHEYDEYGVREVALQSIKLTAYRDFADYIKYLKGVKLV